MRRIEALALTLVLRRVAGAGLDADWQAHFRNRIDQVAGDIDGQRLERRDIKRVQPLARGFGQLVKGRQKTGQRLARAGRGDQQCRAILAMGVKHRELMVARGPATRFKPFGNRFSYGHLLNILEAKSLA